jgi:hypothetical protein
MRQLKAIALIQVALIVTATGASPQQKPLRAQLIGTWGPRSARSFCCAVGARRRSAAKDHPVCPR